MEKKRISNFIYITYGVGVSYAIIDQIFAQWVLYYYLPPNNSGLEPILAPILISLALVIARFVDMSIDPFIGHFSDRFNSKWGRRIPFMAFGGIPLVLVTTLFFFPIKSSEIASFIYLSLIGALFFIFYCIVAGPYNALIPEIGINKDERLNLSTWQSVFRLLYSAIAIILPGLLINLYGKGDTEKGLRGMVITLSVIAMFGIYYTVIFLPEKKYSLGKSSDISLKESFGTAVKDRNFMIYLLGFFLFFLGFNNLRASMNYYIEDIMGKGKVMLTIASALMFGISAIAFYPTNKLSHKFGCRKIMIISQYLMALVSLLIFFLGRGVPIEWGPYIFAFMGLPIAGAAFIFPPAMLSEISAKASEKQNVKIEGMYFGIQGFILNLAFLVSIATLPIILSSGQQISFVNAILEKPEKVEKFGIYMTAIYSFVCFIGAGVFYKIFKED